VHTFQEHRGYCKCYFAIFDDFFEGENLPPDEQSYDSWNKTGMNEIQAVVHFGASWAREGLAYSKQFLIL
jgi:hypothetical protein